MGKPKEWTTTTALRGLQATAEKYTRGGTAQAQRSDRHALGAAGGRRPRTAGSGRAVGRKCARALPAKAPQSTANGAVGCMGARPQAPGLAAPAPGRRGPRRGRPTGSAAYRTPCSWCAAPCRAPRSAPPPGAPASPGALAQLKSLRLLADTIQHGRPEGRLHAKSSTEPSLERRGEPINGATNPSRRLRLGAGRRGAVRRSRRLL
jgi:hypothetical protein